MSNDRESLPPGSLFAPTPLARLEAAGEAAAAADRIDQGWIADALAALRARCVASDKPFLMQEVAATVREPEDGRAWGGVTRIALQREWITAYGFQKDRFGSPKTLWRSRIYA